MRAKSTTGYQCRECRQVHRELNDAAICCASDTHPSMSCWRCYNCNHLYLSPALAETCCNEEEMSSE